jgi:hypothetical protein
MDFEEWWETTIIGGSDFHKAKAAWNAAIEQAKKECTKPDPPFIGGFGGRSCFKIRS